MASGCPVLLVLVLLLLARRRCTRLLPCLLQFLFHCRCGGSHQHQRGLCPTLFLLAVAPPLLRLLAAAVLLHICVWAVALSGAPHVALVAARRLRLLRVGRGGVDRVCAARPPSRH